MTGPLAMKIFSPWNWIWCTYSWPQQNKKTHFNVKSQYLSVQFKQTFKVWTYNLTSLGIWALKWLNGCKICTFHSLSNSHQVHFLAMWFIIFGGKKWWLGLMEYANRKNMPAVCNWYTCIKLSAFYDVFEIICNFWICQIISERDNTYANEIPF